MPWDRPSCLVIIEMVKGATRVRSKSCDSKKPEEKYRHGVEDMPVALNHRSHLQVL